MRLAVLKAIAFAILGIAYMAGVVLAITLTSSEDTIAGVLFFGGMVFGGLAIGVGVIEGD